MGRLSKQIVPDDRRHPHASRSNGIVALHSISAQPYERLPTVDDQHCLIIPLGPRNVEFGDHGEVLPLGPADLFWSHASAQSHPQALGLVDLIMLWIPPKALRHFVEIDMRQLFNEDRLDRESIITDPELRELAMHMHENAVRAEAGSDIMFDALARVFLVTMIRRFGVDQPAHVEFDSGFSARDYTRLVDYIEARLDHRISLKELAALLGMSEASFSRKFKARTGQTPMHFVAEIRLEVARGMLADRSLSFSEIAVRCGFSDQAHFSRSFKKSEGMTPRSYRHHLDGET